MGKYGDDWIQPDSLGTVTLMTDTSISDFIVNATIESEEDSELPVGQAVKFEIIDENSQIHIYRVPII